MPAPHTPKRATRHTEDTNTTPIKIRSSTPKNIVFETPPHKKAKLSQSPSPRSSPSKSPMFDLCEKCVVEVDRLPILPEDPEASHKFGNTTADAYGTWLEGITSLVDAIFQLPSLLLLPPNQQTIEPPPTTPILTELESSICGTMAWSLQHIVSKHLLSLSLAGPGTLRSNNRYGETVFKYLRDLFQRNQHTRMVYAEAYMRVKRSSYTPHIIGAAPASGGGGVSAGHQASHPASHHCFVHACLPQDLKMMSPIHGACDMSEPSPEYVPDFWVKACGGKYLVTAKIGLHWTLAELIYDKYCRPGKVPRGGCQTTNRAV